MKKEMEQWEKDAETKYQIKGLQFLSSYDVYNMLVSALEGGSNYWYWIGNKTVDNINNATPELSGEPFVDRMLTAIQKGVDVNIRDAENPKEILGTLTADSWARAEKLMLENHRSHFADILKEQDDAITADVFFQLAVIGELTYG